MTMMTSRVLQNGSSFQVGKNAQFISSRLEVFERLWQRQQAEFKEKPHTPIVITLPDGKCVEGVSFTTTPLDIAKGISAGLANNVIVANVANESGSADRGEKLVDADEEEEQVVVPCQSCSGGSHVSWELWDLTRPLEASCRLQLLKFDDPEARHVFWHSSAHVLGQCIEAELGAHLTIGPALERGFYYDAYVGEEFAYSQELYSTIEKHAERIVKEDQTFQRLVISKEEAKELFQHNPFKLQLISSKIPEGAKTTCYRCGPLVDLCRGPHVSSTAKIKAFSIEKHSSAYWLGQANNDSLQRMYGISFPDAKLMKEHKRLMEEAKKRDHRLLGNTLGLYFFETNLSPGSCFWLPEGAKIYNKLVHFIRTEYRLRGFEEVISPNIYSSDLFKVSGHYQNYKENMYMFQVEGKEWGLKPMNCPGHCLMFKHMNPSYRQLPIRMADFGVLHRNELSGSLSGLTRVRRFQQDDAHIFLRMDQVKTEVKDALDFLFFVYELMGFTFELKLSTRPKKALGSEELWTKAEEQLTEALNMTGRPWSVNPGDGAFYGPKIDVRLQDAIQRWHQCGTIQLDFQMPIRFNLSYRTEEQVAHAKDDPKDSSLPHPSLPGSWEQELKKGYERPVMVHRAILGSVERMCAVIVEHTKGKFPFWMSPRQAVVCPISEKHIRYGAWVANTLHNFGYDVSLDDGNKTFNKKVREAQIGQWNFILVVGPKEEESRTVTVRDRDDPANQVSLSLEQLLEKFSSLNCPASKPLQQFVPFEPMNE